MLAVIHVNALMLHCYLNELHIYRTNMYQSCKVSTRSWWKPLTSSVSGSRGRNPSIDSFSENNEKARIDGHSRSLPCLSCPLQCGNWLKRTHKVSQCPLWWNIICQNKVFCSGKISYLGRKLPSLATKMQSLLASFFMLVILATTKWRLKMIYI